LPGVRTTRRFCLTLPTRWLVTQHTARFTLRLYIWLPGFTVWFAPHVPRGYAAPAPAAFAERLRYGLVAVWFFIYGSLRFSAVGYTVGSVTFHIGYLPHGLRSRLTTAFTTRRAHGWTLLRFTRSTAPRYLRTFSYPVRAYDARYHTAAGCTAHTAQHALRGVYALRTTTPLYTRTFILLDRTGLVLAPLPCCGCGSCG